MVVPELNTRGEKAFISSLKFPVKTEMAASSHPGPEPGRATGSPRQHLLRPLLLTPVPVPGPLCSSASQTLDQKSQQLFPENTQRESLSQVYNAREAEL